MAVLAPIRQPRVDAEVHPALSVAPLQSDRPSPFPTGPLVQYPTEQQGVFDCIFGKGNCDEVNKSIFESMVNSSPATGVAVKVGNYSVEPFVMNLIWLARKTFTNKARSIGDPSIVLRGVVDIKRIDPNKVKEINRTINALDAVGEILHNINVMPRGPGKVWIRDRMNQIVGYKVYTKYNRSDIAEAVRTPDGSYEIGFFRFSYDNYIGLARERLEEIEQFLQNGVRR